MKFPICLILVALCISMAFADIFPSATARLHEQLNDCLRLSGLPKDHFELVRLDGKIHEDESQENFAVCMLKKLQIMNVDGSVSTDDVSPKILTDNPEATQAARKCVKLVGANVRDTARNIMNCLLPLDIVLLPLF